MYLNYTNIFKLKLDRYSPFCQTILATNIPVAKYAVQYMLLFVLTGHKSEKKMVGVIYDYYISSEVICFCVLNVNKMYY